MSTAFESVSEACRVIEPLARPADRKVRAISAINLSNCPAAKRIDPAMKTLPPIWDKAVCEAISPKL
jgi:hypothetical protein